MAWYHRKQNCLALILLLLVVAVSAPAAFAQGGAILGIPLQVQAESWGSGLYDGFSTTQERGSVTPDTVAISGERLVFREIAWQGPFGRIFITLEPGSVWPSGVELESVGIAGATYSTNCFIHSDRRSISCGSGIARSPFIDGTTIVNIIVSLPPARPVDPIEPPEEEDTGLQETSLVGPQIDRTRTSISSSGVLSGEITPPPFGPVSCYQIEWRRLAGDDRPIVELCGGATEFNIQIPYHGEADYILEMRVRGEFDVGSTIANQDRTQELMVPADGDPWVTIWSQWYPATIATPIVEEVVVPDREQNDGLMIALGETLMAVGVNDVTAANALAAFILGVGFFVLAAGAGILVTVALGANGVSAMAGGIFYIGIWMIAPAVGAIPLPVSAIGFAPLAIAFLFYLYGRLRV